MALPKLKEKEEYTLSDYLSWNEEEPPIRGRAIRYELIDGEPIMLATPSIAHQRIVRRLLTQLDNYLDGKKCEVFMAPLGVALFADNQTDDDEIKTVIEPDIMVVCDPEKLQKSNRVTGAPDLIIEVLSPSTQRHDRLVKFNQYWQAGVREFWIVHPIEKWVQVFLLEYTGYKQETIGFENDQLKINILEECTIDLAAVFAE